MVVIVHTFDKGVQAHVIEAWLPYYIPFAELQELYNSELQSSTVPRDKLRYSLLRRLLPARLTPLPVQPRPRPCTTEGVAGHRRRNSSTIPIDVASSLFSPSSPSIFSVSISDAAGIPPPSSSSSRRSSGPSAPLSAFLTSQPSTSILQSACSSSASSCIHFSSSQPSTPSESPPPVAAASSLPPSIKRKLPPQPSGLPPLSSHSLHISLSRGETGPVISMADLGRTDSLDRMDRVDCLDTSLNALSPFGQNISRQHCLFEAFQYSTQRCDDFFAAETDRLCREYNDALQQLKAAERALASISKHKRSLAHFQADKVWGDIKSVYRSLHKEIKDLRSFSRTNFDLCIRLVKAYRKSVGRSSRVARGMWQHLRKREFADDARLLALTQELERQYADAFCFGFIPFAHKELYVTVKGEWHVFHVGLRFGACVVLLIWLLWDSLFDNSQGVDLFQHPIVHVYAAVGGGLMLLWTWALNLIVWERAGIDHTAIFAFVSPLTSVQKVFSSVSLATTLYLCNLLLYYKLLLGVAGPLQVLPLNMLPITLVAYSLYRLVVPWVQRQEIWRILAQVVIAPLGAVGFKEVFFAETMTSFNKVSYWSVLAGCYIFRGGFIAAHADDGGAVASAPLYDEMCGPLSATQKYIVPLVIAFPLWLRLLQSLKLYYLTARRFPPLLNACKCGVCLSVVLFAIFNPKYSRGVLNNSNEEGISFSVYDFFGRLSQIATILSTWLWDVIIDWGLFKNRRGLRSNLLFRRHIWVYYIAIVLDLMLRIVWTVSLLPQATVGLLYKFQSRMRFFTPLLELFRRSVWSWLRLEHEQSLRDVQEDDTVAVSNDVLREKRANESKAERTKRLGEIAREVTRLSKAVQLIEACTEAKTAPSGRVRRYARTGTTTTDAACPDLDRTCVPEGSSTTCNPGVSNWDEDFEAETDEDDEEDEDTLVDAQDNLQMDLVSYRSVILEACVVFCFFVGLAIWAAGDH